MKNSHPGMNIDYIGRRSISIHILRIIDSTMLGLKKMQGI